MMSQQSSSRFALHSVRENSIRNHTQPERNVTSALLSLLAILLLVLAFVLPNWYHVKGHGCTGILGFQEFFCRPSEHISFSDKNSKLLYGGFAKGIKDMDKCITSEIVTVQKAICGLSLLAILFCFFQFIFDIAGIHSCQCIRILCLTCRGLGSILSALAIVTIIALYYYNVELMEHRMKSHLNPIVIVRVSFGISYYLVASAGVVAVVSSICNLFQCNNLQRNEGSLLFDEHQEDETFSIPLPHSQLWTHISEQSIHNNLPPPPPYAP